MDNEQNCKLNERLAKDIYSQVASTVNSWAEDLIKGHGREMVNPFTNQSVQLPIADEAKSLHEQLAARGLLQDTKLVGAIRDVMMAVSHAAMFNTLAAIDGSGEFESGLRIDICVGGERLDLFLHEVYFQ